MRYLTTLATEYVPYRVTATMYDGTNVDLSSDVVSLAFVAIGGVPADSDWHAATWVAASVAGVLVGPRGTVDLAAGDYDVWIKIADNPEMPSRQVDVLRVTGGDPQVPLSVGTQYVRSVDGRTGSVTLADRYALTARQVVAGPGLTGGGDLTADRTFTVAYGVAPGTATQGNDPRVVNAVQASMVAQPGGVASLGVDGTVPVGQTTVLLAGRRYRRGDKPLAPSATNALFGGFVNLAAQGDESASAAFRETGIGRPLDIGHAYYTFTDTTFPGTKESAAVAAGRIPMVSWQLTTLSNIVNGSSDAVITARAQALAAFGWPVFLRPGWEMNGNWYSWSGPQNGSDPALFISAWQRIGRLFKKAGATNVAFVWCPNAASSPGGTDTSNANSWRWYYPGDQYVDWVSTDVYNWGDYNVSFGTWQNLRNVLDPIVVDWKANFGGFGGAAKPFLLAEFGSFPTPGNKAHWITDAMAYIKTSGITAISAFDTNASVIQGQSSISWNVDSTTQALTAYTEAASDPYFGGVGIGGATYRARVLANTPFSYWPLGALSGTLPDLGSGANPGTPTALVNRGAPALSAGLGGGGVSFNGSSHVDVGTCGALGSSLSGGFTVEFLVKVGATSGTRTAAAVLGTLNTGTTTGIAVYTDTNKALSQAQGFTTFWYRNEAGVSRALDITTAIYDGGWHHVVWVCDPTQVADTVYVDGVIVTPNSTSNAANTGASAVLGFPLWIGARNNRGAVDNQLIGAVDELSIYPSKLTSGQVTTHYAALTA